MSVVAWLMLVATSLAASPRCAEEPGHAPHAAIATAVAGHGHATKAAIARASVKASNDCCDGDGDGDCCGSHAGPACGCAAMGASVLPSALTAVAALPAAMAYALPVHVSAPNTDLTPPLRPPSV